MTSNLAAPPEGYTMVGPADAPRLVKQRHVRRGWIGIGVLAIVLAALGSATLFRAIGPSQSYLALAQDVPVGTQVTADDLRVVRMNSTPGLSPIPASQVDGVVGQYAAVPLVAETLLSRDQLTDQPVPPPGQQLVAIGLAPNRLPGGELQAGDPVMLVTTSADNAAEPDAAAPRTFPARVHDTQETEGRDDEVVVSLLVSERDGALIASLAAADLLTLVLLAEAGS
jgi:SAF domain-containing protein